MRKEKRRRGAAISHLTIPEKAKAVMIKKSETLSRVESKNPPNAVTLLYFRAIIPSIRSKILPAKAIIARKYQCIMRKTKNKRDGILPNRVSTFGFTFLNNPTNGSRYFSTDGFL